jgi:hypothetical protein
MSTFNSNLNKRILASQTIRVWVFDELIGKMSDLYLVDRKRFCKRSQIVNCAEKCKMSRGGKFVVGQRVLLTLVLEFAVRE